MADVTYAEEKLRDAVEALATSKAPIRERLLAAAHAIVTLTPEDFEDEADQIRLGGLHDMLTSRLAEGPDEGTLAGTPGRISEGEAVAAARTVFFLVRAAAGAPIATRPLLIRPHVLQLDERRDRSQVRW